MPAAWAGCVDRSSDLSARKTANKRTIARENVTCRPPGVPVGISIFGVKFSGFLTCHNQGLRRVRSISQKELRRRRNPAAPGSPGGDRRLVSSFPGAEDDATGEPEHLKPPVAVVSSGSIELTPRVVELSGIQIAKASEPTRRRKLELRGSVGDRSRPPARGQLAVSGPDHGNCNGRGADAQIAG